MSDLMGLCFAGGGGLRFKVSGTDSPTHENAEDGRRDLESYGERIGTAYTQHARYRTYQTVVVRPIDHYALMEDRRKTRMLRQRQPGLRFEKFSSTSGGFLRNVNP